MLVQGVVLNLLMCEVSCTNSKTDLRKDPKNKTNKKIIAMTKSRIRETPTLSNDADSRTDTNLKRLRDLSQNKKK